MSNVYIHIGLHKTATTFLQNKIFPKLKNTVYLSRPYTQFNSAFNKLQYADDSRYKEEDFKNEISRFREQKILISDEMLSGLPYFNYINRSVIAYRLKNIFPDAKIILFLRGQKNMILSLHNTYVKNLNGIQKLESFIWFPSSQYTYEHFKLAKCTYENFRLPESFVQMPFYFQHDYFTLNLTNFFYYELVSFYKNLFKDVYVILFEDFERHPQEVIKRLEEILGDKFHGLDIEQLTKPVNVKLDSFSLEKIRIRNIIKNLTSNRYLLKLSDVYFWFNQYIIGNRIDFQEMDYLEKRIADFYTDNNRQLVQAYPEINLHDYPEEYQLR